MVARRPNRAATKPEDEDGDGDGWSRTKREEGEERGAWNGITTSLPTGAGEKGAERQRPAGAEQQPGAEWQHVHDVEESGRREQQSGAEGSGHREQQSGAEGEQGFAGPACHGLVAVGPSAAEP